MSLLHTSLKVRRHQRHEMITNSSMSNNWHEATINSTSLPPSGYISCYIWSVLSIILADHISTKNKQFLFLPDHSTQDHRSGYMSGSGFESWYRLLAGYSFSEVATFYVLLLSLPSPFCVDVCMHVIFSICHVKLCITFHVNECPCARIPLSIGLVIILISHLSEWIYGWTTEALLLLVWWSWPYPWGWLKLVWLNWGALRQA